MFSSKMGVFLQDLLEMGPRLLQGNTVVIGYQVNVKSAPVASGPTQSAL
jgi:hypothetical protein